MKCAAKNRAGKPCRAPAVAGARHCVMHSGRAVELGSLGGRRRAKYNLGELNDAPIPNSAADLKNFLGKLMVEVLNGKVDPKTANSISYIATGLLRAIEATVVEKELVVSAHTGLPKNALAFEVYEAKWLRDQKARWSAELEKKYADSFPPKESLAI